MIRSLRAAFLASTCCCLVKPALSQSFSTEDRVTRIGFVGRMVADLDRSVAFYKAIGFSQDPAVDSAWRKDRTLDQLYGVKDIQTRTAKMSLVSPGQSFPVYLRELRGVQRKDASHHTPWDPGVTHFGLVVADADAVWEKLRVSGMLRARSWGERLVAPPGQTKGLLAYMTDPDGLDIELMSQRPAAPAENGRPARPALIPGVSHVGVIILDSEKAKAFYGTTFGGHLLSTESPWLHGDFYDSAVGGHGNVLRFFNESFPDTSTPRAPRYIELVEFQNRKRPVDMVSITDIGIGYVGFQVHDVTKFLARARAFGAQLVSKGGIVTTGSGEKAVMIRDPDVGMFVELFEANDSTADYPRSLEPSTSDGTDALVAER